MNECYDSFNLPTGKIKDNKTKQPNDISTYNSDKDFNKTRQINLPPTKQQT